MEIWIQETYKQRKSSGRETKIRFNLVGKKLQINFKNRSNYRNFNIQCIQFGFVAMIVQM